MLDFFVLFSSVASVLGAPAVNASQCLYNCMSDAVDAVSKLGGDPTNHQAFIANVFAGLADHAQEQMQGLTGNGEWACAYANSSCQI